MQSTTSRKNEVMPSRKSDHTRIPGLRSLMTFSIPQRIMGT